MSYYNDDCTFGEIGISGCCSIHLSLSGVGGEPPTRRGKRKINELPDWTMDEIAKIKSEADSYYNVFAYHYDSMVQCKDFFTGYDALHNAMRAHLLGRDLDTPTTWEEVETCRYALEYSYRCFCNDDKTTIKSAEEQYNVNKSHRHFGRGV
jgi:hypothetical protein